MKRNRVIKTTLNYLFTLINNLFLECKLLSQLSCTVFEVFLCLKESMKSIINLSAAAKNRSIKFKSLLLNNIFCFKNTSVFWFDVKTIKQFNLNLLPSPSTRTSSWFGIEYVTLHSVQHLELQQTETSDFPIVPVCQDN